VSRCRAFIDAHTDPCVHRIVLLDARAVLSWEQWHEVESNHGIVLLRGYLRRAVHRGVIEAQPLHPLAMILSGALMSACMLVANAEDPAKANGEAMAIVERLLLGLRKQQPPPAPAPAP
jgi:hypothetical protein